MDELYTKQTVRAQRLQLPICDRTVTTEVTGEISLPDYQPEIKRLLRVSATVGVPNHYVGGGAMEFTGTVDYCVYYTGNDGQVYCYPTSTEYAIRLPLEADASFDLGDAPVCYVDSHPEAIVSRVGGPRRMTVKCRLSSHVKAYGCCVLEERRVGEASEREQRLMDQAQTAVTAYGVSAPVVVRDDILLEGGGGEDVRIVSGDAVPLITEAICANGQVLCRGEVVVKLLLARDGTDAPPATVWRKLPLDAAVPLEGAAVGGEAVASGCCTELNLTVEDGRVVCEAELQLQARARREETVDYSSDVYEIDRESTARTTEYRLPRVLRCVNGNFTQNEARSLSALGLTPMDVVDVGGVATIERVETERGRYVLVGKCRYTLLLSDGNGEGELTVRELELPLRYVVDGAATGEITSYEGQVCVVSARARMDAERLVIDAELGVWLCLEGETTVRAVSEVTVGEPIGRERGELRLCYPAPDDTLWSVGKRYAVSLDELHENNRLPGAPRADAPNSLGETRVLVV